MDTYNPDLAVGKLRVLPGLGAARTSSLYRYVELGR